MAATEYDNMIRQTAAVFERINVQGENEAFQIADDLLNRHQISDRECREIAGALVRSAMSFEINSDARKVWQSCTRYLNLYGGE